MVFFTVHWVKNQFIETKFCVILEFQIHEMTFLSYEKGGEGISIKLLMLCKSRDLIIQ